MSDPCNAGVPQGSMLGPMLFLLFINDMLEVISTCNMEMYADDVRIRSWYLIGQVKKMF